MSIVASIIGNEIWNSAGNTTVDKATNYYSSQGGYANSQFGKVILDRKSAKNSRSHGIGVAKVQAYAVVKDVLEKGIITVPMAYYNTNPNKAYQTGMITADVEISGQNYTCVVTVCMNNEGLLRVWNHEVTPYPNQKPQDASITNHVSGCDTTPHQHQGAMAKIAKDFQTNNKEKNESMNMKKNVVKLNENTLKQIVAESVKKVLKEYELSDREKDIMRRYWSDIENRRMSKQKYEPVNPQSWKKSTPNNQTPKHYSYNSNLNEEGEGIEMMGSIPSESYGKYGNLMEKLDDVGNKEIDYILKDRTRFYNNGTFSSKQVYEMLNSLKKTMIHALDTRYW